jgi:hypothetical protein
MFCKFITCSECGKVIHKKDAYGVLEIHKDPYGEQHSKKVCKDCHKYDEEVFHWGYSEPLYYKRMRVDKFGEPVGYKKTKK